MSQALLDRLTAELGWPLLETPDALDAWCAEPGERALLIPGDPAKNLETADAAVIVPELAQAFQHRFALALVGPGIERATRERFDVWPTPSLVFLRDGATLGSIPKVRDWDDYIARTRAILDGRAPVAAE
jgi:hydrogenase-1 operon protein HyaE